jgi:hypothetical protein
VLPHLVLAYPDVSGGWRRTRSDTSDTSDTDEGLLGTLMGVFLPCMQNILGIILFLRLSWIVGQAGVGVTLGLVSMCCASTLLTGLSLSCVSWPPRRAPAPYSDPSSLHTIVALSHAHQQRPCHSAHLLAGTEANAGMLASEYPSGCRQAARRQRSCDVRVMRSTSRRTQQPPESTPSSH